MESTTIKESLTHNIIGSGVKDVTVTLATWKKKQPTSGTFNFIYTPIIEYSSDLVYSLNKTTFANFTQLKTGTYTFKYTPVVSSVDTSSVLSTFDSDTFVKKVNEVPDTYTFTYTQDNKWQLKGKDVTMSEYGLTTKGTEKQGNEIVIYYTSNSWYRDSASINMASYGISTTGTEKVGNTIEVNYRRNEWQKDATAVTLADYGITISSGTPAIDDTIQIVFVAEQVGVVRVANPTSLYSIGLNQFNVNGDQIFTGHTIATNGKISEASSSYVIYFKCLGKQTYTIYNSKASSITRVGYLATAPTISSTVTVLSAVTTASSGQACTNNTTRTHVTPSADGYLVVAATDIENLCCHLTWSGYNDDVYESYWDYNFTIPYRADNGETITDYGLAKLDTTYFDEIDFSRGVFHKRTDRMEYSAENLATVQAKKVPYLYDSSYIYYGIPEETYTLGEISSAYRVSDFGTEQFIGTDLKLGATVFYQSNLKDKLRRSVEVLDNKVTSIASNATNDQYPSAKAVYDLEYNVWKMLGLHVDTFSTTKTYAVGAYVVRGHTLYKCTKAVTSAGAWNASNWTESYLFTAS